MLYSRGTLKALIDDAVHPAGNVLDEFLYRFDAGHDRLHHLRRTVALRRIERFTVALGSSCFRCSGVIRCWPVNKMAVFVTLMATCNLFSQSVVGRGLSAALPVRQLPCSTPVRISRRSKVAFLTATKNCDPPERRHCSHEAQVKFWCSLLAYSNSCHTWSNVFLLSRKTQTIRWSWLCQRPYSEKLVTAGAWLSARCETQTVTVLVSDGV
ncbi:hypothetical protein EVAR_101681_1 [Eumeta japonica]|uniref:Uncharacterized protein n=1 Tax=Eumeta variegata TaxID=151549 RepID=A0A4C1SKD6_EUMVA|nr:hypothetical protein EVAR_101681_1 [Eumeta japonica]